MDELIEELQSIEGVDLTPFLNVIDKMKAKSTELKLENENNLKIIDEKDKEIGKLKEQAWKMFERQNFKEEKGKKESKKDLEQKPKSLDELIKVE